MKSGYPLENDVARILSDLQFPDITRNVVYASKSEDGEPAIRSVDFRCSEALPTQTIPHPDWPRRNSEVASFTFIVDAKFSEDETFWFIPAEKRVPMEFPYLIPMLLSNDYGRTIKLYRKEFVKAAQAPSKWLIASSGKKVKEQSKERNSLADYQVQMIGALQSIIEEESQALGQVNMSDSSYIRDVRIYIPIIVTNAPLYILNPVIGTDDVRKAKSSRDICTPIDRVVVAQPHFFHVKEALKALSETIAGTRSHPKLSWLPQDLTVFPVLFVNVKSLADVIQSFRDQFATALGVDKELAKKNGPKV